MSKVVELTEDNFESEVVSAGMPVLVDFWSPSCGPCRALVPILEELAEENDGDVKVGKVNVAEFAALGARYGIEMLPTLLFFGSGKVVERMVGVQSKEKLQDALDEID